MNWAGVARSRWRILRHVVFAGGRTRRVRRSPVQPVVGGSLAIVLAGLVCVSLASLFAPLAGAGAAAGEAAGALGLVFSVAIGALLVFDLHEGVTALLTDSDLELLRRAPVRAPELFALKLLDAFPRTSLLLFVLVLPAVVAFAAMYPLPLWSILVVPIVALSLWAIPLGLGAAVAIAVIRVVPARGARETLGLLSTLTLLSLWLANSFLLPRLIALTGDPLAALHSVLEAVPHAHRFSPGAWAGRAIAAAAEGRPGAALLATLELALAAALALGLAALSAGANLEEVQARLLAGGGGRRARDGQRRSAAAANTRRPPTQIGAMLRRDARLLARNWIVLGDILTAAVLWTLLPVVGAPLYDASTPALARAMLVALTVGLGYEVGARAAPLERDAWVWLRLAPVTPARWVIAKLVGAGLVSTAVLSIAATGTALALHLGAAEIGETLAVAIPALLVALVVGLWTGTAFGDREWTNPRAMLTLPGRMTATALLLAQAAGWLLAVTLADANRAALPPDIALWAPTLVCAAAIVLPLKATIARLESGDWR